MKLSAYLEQTQKTQDEFARDVGCSQGRVSQLLAGETPSFDLARRIAVVTDGAVGLIDWPAPKRSAA